MARSSSTVTRIGTATNAGITAGTGIAIATGAATAGAATTKRTCVRGGSGVTARPPHARVKHETTPADAAT